MGAAERLNLRSSQPEASRLCLSSTEANKVPCPHTCDTTCEIHSSATYPWYELE